MFIFMKLWEFFDIFEYKILTFKNFTILYLLFLLKIYQIYYVEH